MNLICLFRYLKKKDMLYILISLSFIVTQVWLDLKLPDYMSEITRMVQQEGSVMSDLLRSSGMMLLCSLGSLAASFVTGFFVAKIATGFSMRLREAVYDKVMSFSTDGSMGNGARLIVRPMTEEEKTAKESETGKSLGSNLTILKVVRVLPLG